MEAFGPSVDKDCSEGLSVLPVAVCVSYIMSVERLRGIRRRVYGRQ
jgi:hypothetical protein